MNVRFLAVADAGALRERYGDALPADDAAGLAAAVDARLLALAQPPDEGALALLRAAGVTVARAGGETLLAVSRAALDRARGRARDAAERGLVNELLRRARARRRTRAAPAACAIGCSTCAIRPR